VETRVARVPVIETRLRLPQVTIITIIIMEVDNTMAVTIMKEVIATAAAVEIVMLCEEVAMKAEYREKLGKFLAHFDKVYEEITQEDIISAGTVMDELIESRDMEVLRGLMEVLTKKAFGCGMIDESFPQQIFDYYTHEQIMDAIFDKFDAIYNNDDGVPEGPGLAHILEDICSDLWDYGTEEGFQRFRELFNKVRPRHAERFLNDMEKYPNEEKVPMIQTLREDMKKW
jgi:hypothetical protein